jgi:dCMP deaminase
MNAARLAAQRSSCLRLQVGAVLVRSGRVVVWGYNGTPAGQPHCTAADCGPDKPCTKTVHAEANCVYFAARLGIETLDTVMYTTDSPCKTCAEAIINAGIVEVVYEEPYRDLSPVETLEASGIIVRHFKPGPLGLR